MPSLFPNGSLGARGSIMKRPGPSPGLALKRLTDRVIDEALDRFVEGQFQAAAAKAAGAAGNA